MCGSGRAGTVKDRSTRMYVFARVCVYTRKCVHACVHAYVCACSVNPG